MIDSANSSAQADDEIKPWWPLWNKNQEWQDDVSEEAVRKTLDLPKRRMQITNTKSGIGPLGLIGVALAAGLPSALIAWSLLKTPKPPAPAVENPTAWKYKIKWGFRDGQPFSELRDEQGNIVKESE